jgi:hypothetical protein
MIAGLPTVLGRGSERKGQPAHTEGAAVFAA